MCLRSLPQATPLVQGQPHVHRFRASVQIKSDLFIAARDPTIDKPGGIRGAECQYLPFSLHRCVCVCVASPVFRHTEQHMGTRVA